MGCLHIDESGYTGFDLLNPEQRFQGATAVVTPVHSLGAVHPFRRAEAVPPRDDVYRGALATSRQGSASSQTPRTL